MPNEEADELYDVVIVGAGFAGLYALHRLRADGLRVRVLEAGDGIGGTWFWNRYPGARCDVESMQYSYSFSDEIQQEWDWSELYAAQPEILAYIEFVADRLDLRRDVQLRTRVDSAAWDQGNRAWRIATNAGQMLASRYVVMATGPLSVPLTPQIAGLETFSGQIYRTFDWPSTGVDLSNRRVGLIGTGSSGIQATPKIAAEAGHLTVFQRMPNYSIPSRNRPMDPAYAKAWKDEYPARRKAARLTRNNTLNNAGVEAGCTIPAETRKRELHSRWQSGGIGFMYAYPDMTSDPEVNAQASDFVRERIAEIVADPSTARKLQPTTYGIGGKRICVDTDYYETFNRPNVSLADIKADPIEAVTPGGIRTRGTHHDLDVLVFAVGFDAMTGALLSMDIIGDGSMSLRDAWADGPATYLGIMVAGFPNLFMVNGPGSPSVFTNMVTSIEQHVDWIADCLAYACRQGGFVVETTPEAQLQWGAEVAEVADRTILSGVDSWYTGANVPGKPRVFLAYLGGAAAYTAFCDEVVAVGYRGLTFDGRTAVTSALPESVLP